MNAGATDAWGALCFVAYSCLYWSNGSNCRSHSNCIVNGGRRHSGVMSQGNSLHVQLRFDTPAHATSVGCC